MLSIVVYLEGSEEIYVIKELTGILIVWNRPFFGGGCDGRQKGVSLTTDLQKKLRST